MKHWIILALFTAVLAGCGGGSSTSTSDRVGELESELEQARQEVEAAELAAEEERQARLDAEQERDSAQGEVAGAEEETRQAEQERDEAQQKLDRFVALEIVTKIPINTNINTNTDIPSLPEPLSLSYRQPVLATATGATFTSTSTGSSGGWFTTTRSGSTEQRRDFVEIFSNVEAPRREDIRDYSARTTVPWRLTFDAQGRPTNHLKITTANAGTIAASSRFPRPSTQPQGELETFTVTDRGPNQKRKDTANERKMEVDALNRDGDPTNDEVFADDPLYDDYRLSVRNTVRYPERYSIDISGSLQGAPGTYRCAGTSETTGSGGSCTVDLSGPNDYVFTNGKGVDGKDVEWQFIPTSATSKVIIPDGEYMWFGWWKREPIETTPNALGAVFNYAANYGGTNALTTTVAGATGSATYEGAAIGYYGFYDIEAAEDDRSRAGRFQAKATLTADFDATGEGTLSGSITEFDTEPTWSVTLKSQTISTGAVVDAPANSVSWSIRGLPRDGGQWEAQFYSNFEAPANTAQPTGVAGAFTAQYGSHRKMIGAFGAEREN